MSEDNFNSSPIHIEILFKWQSLGKFSMNEGIFEKDPVSKIKRENDGVRKRLRWRKEAEKEN